MPDVAPSSLFAVVPAGVGVPRLSYSPTVRVVPGLLLLEVSSEDVEDAMSSRREVAASSLQPVALVVS